MAYAKINQTGCGIHKNRAKLRLDFFLNPDDPNYKGDSPFHSHFIYPDKDASNADIKAEIEKCLNYFYAFHQHCWDKGLEFIDEWKKVPSQVGQVRCPFMKGDSKDLTANQDKVQSILSRSQEFQVGISKVPPQDLNIGDKGTIDIGEAAIDREYNTTATKIAKGNPANASGTIDTVEAQFPSGGGTGLKFGTHSMSGSNATTRDYEDIGDYIGGSKQEYTGLNIDVVSGDLIGGSVISGGGWEYDSSGYGGLWSTSTKLPLSSEACADQPGRAISLYGTGTEEGGVTHYGVATLTGVGTLAGIGRGIFIGKATLTGEGTLASIGSFLRYAKATLSGTGTLSAIGSFLRYGKASLSGTGTLAAIGRGIFAGKATLSGVGTLTASAVVEGEGVNVTPSPAEAVCSVVAPTIPLISTITTESHELSTSYLSSRKLVRTSDGVLHAIYYRDDDSYVSQIYHAYSSDEGKTWTEEALTSGDYAQIEPSIAVDSDDCLHVVWDGLHSGSINLEIRYRKYDGSWGSIVNLTSEYPAQRHPAIAVDSGDNLHVVWNGKHSESTTYYQIRYIKYTTSWGSITNLTSASYDNYEPSIAIDGNDYLHIVWKGDNIEYRKFTDSWQDIVKLEDSEYGQDCPCIAVDGNDYVHVVWFGSHADSTSYKQIRYRKYTDSWQTIENLTSGVYDCYEPSIAVDSSNYLNVIWYGESPENPLGYWQIRHIKYTNSWGSVEDLTSGDVTRWYPNLLCARHPEGLCTPTSGYAFIWVDGTTLKYYASYDLIFPITPSPAQAIASVIAPTVIKGSIIITPEHIDTIAQVVQPNVRQGNIIFSPTPIDTIAKAVNPSVIYGAIIPDPVSAIGSGVNPVVVLSSISITPTYIEAIGQVVAPIVSIGEEVLYITPTPIDAIGGSVNPTVIHGSISLTPSFVSAIAEGLIGKVIQASIIIQNGKADVVGQVIAPTVIGGDITLTPESIEAIARGENPEVILASMTVTPEFVKALAGVIAPTVLETWVGRKLRIKIVTSQYRSLNVITSQNRNIDVVTAQKRKIRTLTTGG